MKRVSFKVAKAIKEAGYPQKYTDYDYVYKDGKEHLFSNAECEADKGEVHEYCAMPYYMEAWLWLWRENKVHIEILHDVVDDCAEAGFGQGQDPEEAIKQAIEHLCDNDLIK